MLNTKKGQVCFTPLYILSRGQTSIPDWLKFSALSSSATWRILQGAVQGHTYLGSSVHRKWLFPHVTYIFFCFHSWPILLPWNCLHIRGHAHVRCKLCPSSQFHQHLTSSFFADILSTENYQAKLQLEKSFKKHFHTKKVCIKCWWNWHQLTLAAQHWNKIHKGSNAATGASHS